MAAGTVASRALGFVRSAVLVAALGSASDDSTFTVANTVPNIIYILLAGGVLNAVFVPQLVRAMKEGPSASRAYSDRLLTLAGLVLLAVTRGRDRRWRRSSSSCTTGRLTPEPTPTSRRCSRSGACRRSSSTASTRCSGRSSTPAAASVR